ncbi:hypothetical protein ARMSODRAFT_968131 [Armillaria solidipes]|uniref:Uncharacterized protein n=1 Tax=Armillaria solidipes TaxID=1076256 RepID=A0A2H3CHG0_9AGAR|nr:hypothetical protein ARMSODRAFT_968131 [Armillaria solidipes]
MKYQMGQSNTSIKYHESATPEPYKSAPTSTNLTAEDYKASTDEQAAMEERYDKAVSKHEEWKAMKAKEARAEALRLKEVARAAKLEALRQQKLEKEKERLWLEAEEKQWKLDLKQEELEEAMAKKVLDDLVKAKEKADKDNEKLLAAAGFVLSGEEGDSESDLADPKTVAMAKLRKRHRIAEGKKKVGSADGRKCKFRLASVVESGEDGNVSAGPLGPKRLKMEPEPMAQDKVFTGSGCLFHPWRCTFNKGGEDSSAMESPNILELLQDISSRLMCLEDKVDAVTGRVEDLSVKYPEDFIPKSVKAKFKASRLELWKAGDIYCEVLREVAKHRLDRDMALIKAERLTALSLDLLLGMDNPYKILNKSFWIRSVGITSLCDKMLAHNKFLQACQDFYNMRGHQVEWQLWKRLLKDQEGYRVKDLDEPLDLEEEICNDMIPGAESISIPELDALIKMPMPYLDSEEEVEKERHRQATARLRAERHEKGEVAESEVEMYEDLELVLVQEVEKGKGNVEMADPSSTDAA